MIQSDNLGTITVSYDVTYHAQIKHINVAYHFIHERVASNKVALTYVWSKENPADLMTMGLKINQHHNLPMKLEFLGAKLRGSVEQQFDAAEDSTLM